MSHVHHASDVMAAPERRQHRALCPFLHRQDRQRTAQQGQGNQPLQQAVEVHVEAEGEAVAQDDAVAVCHFQAHGRCRACAWAWDLKCVGAGRCECVLDADDGGVWRDWISPPPHVICPHTLQKHHSQTEAVRSLNEVWWFAFSLKGLPTLWGLDSLAGVCWVFQLANTPKGVIFFLVILLPQQHYCITDLFHLVLCSFCECVSVTARASRHMRASCEQLTMLHESRHMQHIGSCPNTETGLLDSTASSW